MRQPVLLFCFIHDRYIMRCSLILSVDGRRSECLPFLFSSQYLLSTRYYELFWQVYMSECPWSYITMSPAGYEKTREKRRRKYNYPAKSNRSCRTASLACGINSVPMRVNLKDVQKTGWLLNYIAVKAHCEIEQSPSAFYRIMLYRRLALIWLPIDLCHRWIVILQKTCSGPG